MNPKPVSMEVETPTVTTEKMKNRTGKASKSRRQDEFRRRMNAKQYEAKRAEIQKNFLSDDEFEALEKSLKSLDLTVQPRAIPLTVATRGVGFASALEYSRMATTWSLNALEEICTIHQYFRVNISLIEYQLSLAYQCQGELLSYPFDTTCLIGEDLRQLIQPVTKIPIAMANILHSIGRVEGSTVFHAVPFKDALNSGQLMALYFGVKNARTIVTYLSTAQSPPAEREAFHSLNPLPGSRWVLNDDGWLLMNPDEVWPENYGVNQLATDLHAYQNLLTRVGNRLPRSFISTHTWSGKGSRSLTTSMDPVPMAIVSHFKAITTRTTSFRRRKADGTEGLIETSNSGYEFCGDTIVGLPRVNELWTPDDNTSAIELTLGSAALVGEHLYQQPRLQVQGRRFAQISSGNVLQKLVDAPRH